MAALGLERAGVAGGEHGEVQPRRNRRGLIDSFSIAYIGVFIQEAFGLLIPDVELTAENFDSLAMIAARVEAGAGRR